jgi:hypothetical protein
MPGVEILVGEDGVLFDQVLKDVGTDTSLTNRRSNARFVDRLGVASGGWPVDDRSVDRMVRNILAVEGQENARALV